MLSSAIRDRQAERQTHTHTQLHASNSRLDEGMPPICECVYVCLSVCEHVRMCVLCGVGVKSRKCATKELVCLLEETR